MIRFEIARFGVVGGISTVIHGAVALLATITFDANLVQANLSGYICAVAFSFLGHSLWVFRHTPSWNSLLKYLTINTAILMIIISTSALLDHFHANRIAGVIIITLLIPAVSYYIHKTITFKDNN